MTISSGIDLASLVNDSSLFRLSHYPTKGESVYLRIPHENPVPHSDWLCPNPIIVAQVTLGIGDLKPDMT